MRMKWVQGKEARKQEKVGEERWEWAEWAGRMGSRMKLGSHRNNSAERTMGPIVISH